MAGARAAVLSMQMRRPSGISVAYDVKKSGSYNRLPKMSGCAPAGGSSWNKDDNGHALQESTKYGIPLTSDATVHQRYKDRNYWQRIRVKLCDWCFFVGLCGLLLSVLVTELQAVGIEFYDVRHIVLCLKAVILLSTLVLLIMILTYHYVEIQISLVETGYDHWWVGLTKDRMIRLTTELLVCIICPLPGTGMTNTPYLGPRPTSATTEMSSVSGLTRVAIPVDVLLCLPMFLRGYLLCRFLVLHSRQYQDPSTRTIASLNQVAMDLPFVIRTKLTDHPIKMLSVFTIIFWFCFAWMLTQCERYTDESNSGLYHLLNYVWFVIVTFFSIGYGDVVPYTFCGRTLAITVGIVGTIVSSTLIAVIGRLMQLSLAEQRVNRLIAETNLSKSYKHSAASVLQHTWMIHRYTRRLKDHPKEMRHIRYHQRSLWQSILTFRKIRWQSRMLAEQTDDILAITKMQNEVSERMNEFVYKQSLLQRQVDAMNVGVAEIQAALGGGSSSNLSVPQSTTTAAQPTNIIHERNPSQRRSRTSLLSSPSPSLVGGRLSGEQRRRHQCFVGGGGKMSLQTDFYSTRNWSPPPMSKRSTGTSAAGNRHMDGYPFHTSPQQSVTNV